MNQHIGQGKFLLCPMVVSEDVRRMDPRENLDAALERRRRMRARRRRLLYLLLLRNQRIHRTSC